MPGPNLLSVQAVGSQQRQHLSCRQAGFVGHIGNADLGAPGPWYAILILRKGLREPAERRWV